MFTKFRRFCLEGNIHWMELSQRKIKSILECLFKSSSFYLLIYSGRGVYFLPENVHYKNEFRSQNHYSDWLLQTQLSARNRWLLPQNATDFDIGLHVTRRNLCRCYPSYIITRLQNVIILSFNQKHLQQLSTREMINIEDGGSFSSHR